MVVMVVVVVVVIVVVVIVFVVVVVVVVFLVVPDFCNLCLTDAKLMLDLSRSDRLYSIWHDRSQKE